LADRCYEISPGRPRDPRPSEPTQHDNWKAIGGHEAGATIGCAEVGPVLELRDMIEIERADGEILSSLCGGYDRRNGFRHRKEVDGDTINNEIIRR
jgi:hypothetical protein